MSGSIAPVYALGSGSRVCNGLYPGSMQGNSYQVSFSAAGGTTQRQDCGNRVSVYVRYNVYPGGPLATTGMTYGSTYVSVTQAGTVNAFHLAWAGSSSVQSLGT